MIQEYLSPEHGKQTLDIFTSHRVTIHSKLKLPFPEFFGCGCVLSFYGLHAAIQTYASIVTTDIKELFCAII